MRWVTAAPGSPQGRQRVFHLPPNPKPSRTKRGASGLANSGAGHCSGEDGEHVVPAKPCGPASLVKIIDVVRNQRGAQNFPMTLIRFAAARRSGACRALPRRGGRARRPLPSLNPQVGDLERRRPGGNLFASVPRGRCTRERGRAVQRRYYPATHQII
jgi:hypothetical protein